MLHNFAVLWAEQHGNVACIEVHGRFTPMGLMQARSGEETARVWVQEPMNSYADGKGFLQYNSYTLLCHVLDFDVWLGQACVSQTALGDKTCESKDSCMCQA